MYVLFSNSGTVWFLWPYQLAADAPPFGWPGGKA